MNNFSPLPYHKLPSHAFGPIHGWIGGKMPVDGDKIVRLYFDSRAPYTGPAYWRKAPNGKDLPLWEHEGRGADIVGYQVCTWPHIAIKDYLSALSGGEA